MKNKRKSVLAVSAVTLSLSLLAGCGSSPTSSAPTPGSTTKKTDTPATPAASTGSKGDAKTLRIAFTASTDSVANKTAEKFKELVEKYTNGSVQVQVFPSGQLGGELSLVQQVQQGSLESTAVSTAPVGNIIPEITLFDLPFIFKDETVVDKVVASPFAQKIFDLMPAKQLVGLAYWENGFRDLTNSKHPVKTMEDLNGMKIRTMENPLHLDVWRALGANPTPMSFDQLFNALQQKVIDAQENPVQLIYASKFYEAQKYLTITHHVYSPHVVMVSKTFWDGLTKDQQAEVKKAADEARDFNVKANRSEYQDDLNKLKEKGMEIDTLSDSERDKIKAAIKPVVDKYAAKYPELSKQLFDTINEAEKK